MLPQERGMILHELKRFGQTIRSVLQFLEFKGLNTEATSEFHNTMKKIAGIDDPANIEGILKDIYAQLEEGKIIRLKTNVRSAVPSEFRYGDEQFDRENELREISYNAKALRAYCGYYLGEQSVKKETINLNELLLSCSVIQDVLRQVLKFDFQAGNINIHTDEAALFIAVGNLITNALETTADDRKNEIIVRTRLSENGKMVLIEF